MLTKRLVVCLDVQAGTVVKGVAFQRLRLVGDPVALAREYERQGADEIVFLDVAATVQGRRTLLDVVRRTAECLFVPLTVGGGVRALGDVDDTLRAGADKVSINSAAVERPSLLTECADRFGSQCVVASIDAARDDATGQWRVFVKGGSQATTRDAVSWARECADRGAGEILLTSIDRDGTRTGYDLPLTQAVRAAVAIPIVASGGAGSAQDVCDAVHAGADAALVAGLLHDGLTTVPLLKAAMRRALIPVREIANVA